MLALTMLILSLSFVNVAHAYTYGIFGQTYPGDGGPLRQLFTNSISGWRTGMSNTTWTKAQDHVNGVNAQSYWIYSGDTDDQYSDSVNLAVYVGHGTPRGNLLDEYKMHVGNDTGNNDILVKPSQCKWGDVTKTWLALEACQLLYNPDGQLVKDWDQTFQGLHGILGWSSEMAGPPTGTITLGQCFGAPFSKDTAIGTAWQQGTKAYYARHGWASGIAADYRAIINYGSGRTFDYMYESKGNLWPNYGTPGYTLNSKAYSSWSCPT
jgi:hypothetical protein